MGGEYGRTWDLDSIFQGGSRSTDFLDFLNELAMAPERLRLEVERLTLEDTPENLDRWDAVLQMRDEMENRLMQARAFVGCLMSQNVDDTEAKLLSGRVQRMVAAFEGVELLLKDRIRFLPEPVWQRLLADPRFRPISFQLQELRDEVAELLPTDQETLIVDLSVDGFRAWERLYHTIVGRIAVPWNFNGAPWEANGRTERLSVGQAYNRFAHPNPLVRAKHFENWTAAWQGEAELCAAALNHLGGFRLSVYQHRGWDSVLARALKANRMSEATLNAMWEAVDSAKDSLVAFLQRRSRLLGQDAIHWYDEQAPLFRADRSISYAEAANFVIEQFSSFSGQMAELARLALESRWVESEDRPGKSPGGYCTRFPLSRQSRIFMTFGGNSWGVSTLAHELGHAFHNHVQWDLPPMARGFTMSTAETASTFAELVVGRAAISRATSREEKLELLDESLRNAVAMFMNIHARFLFERNFYEARRKGLLSVDQLNEMMLEAQKEAFRGALATYHPQFWASKGHFYGAGTPFYNFPYTFGFLFSAGIFARSMDEGPGFEDKYVELLRDTGRMTTEELARRHLQADLTRPDFWKDAVDLVMAGAPDFMAMTAEG